MQTLAIDVSQIRCEVSSVIDPELEHKWFGLFKKNKHASPFLNPHLINIWQTAYKSDIAELCIFWVCDETGNLKALLPMYFNQSGILSLVGTNHNKSGEPCFESLDILIAPDIQHYQHSLFNALYRKILELKSNAIFFGDVKSSSVIMQFVCFLRTLGFKSLIQNNGYEYISTLSDIPSTIKSQKYNLKRYINRYNKTEHLHFEVITDLPIQLGILNNLSQLHQNRWMEEGLQDAFSNPSFYYFVENAIKSSNTETLISGIFSDTQPIVLHFYFVKEGSLYFYQTGLDKKFKPNIRAGILAHLFTMQWANQNGYDIYNLMRSKDPKSYKKELAQQGADLKEVILFPNYYAKLKYQFSSKYSAITNQFKSKIRKK